MNTNTEKLCYKHVSSPISKENDCDADFRREDKSFRESSPLTTQNGTELMKGIPKGKASEDFIRRKRLVLKIFICR